MVELFLALALSAGQNAATVRVDLNARNLPAPPDATDLDRPITSGADLDAAEHAGSSGGCGSGAARARRLQGRRAHADLPRASARRGGRSAGRERRSSPAGRPDNVTILENRSDETIQPERLVVPL
jgi:hypothetical protein